MPVSPGGAQGTALGEVGATSMLMLGLDLAALREHHEFDHLRERMFSGYFRAPEHAQVPVVCGYEPLDRLRRLTLSVPPGPLGSSLAVVARGDGATEEFDRCLTRFSAEVVHQPLAPAPAVGAHPVYTVRPRPTDQPNLVGIFSSGVVISSPAVLSQTLAVLDGTQPAGTGNPSFAAAHAALGEGALVYLYVDLRTLRPLLPAAQRPHFEDLPGVSATQQLAVFDDSVAFGASIAPHGQGGMRFSVMVGFAQAGSAELAARALQASLASFATRLAAGGLDDVRQNVGFTVGAQGMLQFLARSAQRLRFTVRGLEVRANLDLTGAELEAMERDLAAPPPRGPTPGGARPLPAFPQAGARAGAVSSGGSSGNVSTPAVSNANASTPNASVARPPAGANGH